MRVGLALSGGGFRATVFHLGVLARLARGDMLEEVEFLSTVSGGSLCIALVFAAAGDRWPSSQDYLTTVLPRARELLTVRDLIRPLVWRKLRALVTTGTHSAADLGDLLRDQWSLDITLGQLPRRPWWILNATCHETGKRWRFDRASMGDYVFGYADAADFPLSHAVAASSAFPPIMGALTIDTHRYRWEDYDDAGRRQPVAPAHDRVHLWDGGLYDNLGIEALFKRIESPESSEADVDFLIVSDAAAPLPTAYTWSPWTWAVGWRLYSITGNQVQALRARWLLQHLTAKGSANGRYLQLGNSTRAILAASGAAPDGELDCLTDDEVDKARRMATTIRSVTADEYGRQFRHGYEVADATLHAYGRDRYALSPYSAVTWA